MSIRGNSARIQNLQPQSLWKVPRKAYSCAKPGEGGIGIIEMLFCTSMVALVGGGEHPDYSLRNLKIINTKRLSVICELSFATAILAVKLNRKRLIVTLDEHIYLYDISSMKLLHTIDTNPNPNGESF